MVSMKKIVMFVIAALCGACLAGCGGGSTPVPPPALDYYVSIQGDDNNPGTQAEPFRTISKALADARPGLKINVAPGTYVQGENFPLRVTLGVELLGDVEGTGMQVKIQGAGDVAGTNYTAAVVMDEGGRIAGFEVQNPVTDLGTQDAAVLILGSSATVDHCRLVDSEFGLAVKDGTNQVITHNLIHRNQRYGLSFDQAGDDALVARNYVSGNFSGGVLVARALPDLGGGAAGSEGLNRFGRNGAPHDLHYHAGTQTLMAKNNYWDDAAPLTSGDIFLSAGSSPVDADDANVWTSLT